MVKLVIKTSREQHRDKVLAERQVNRGQRVVG
jgi:hypothetical protein